MERVERVVIPESHIAFANEVAALAEKHGMESFSMKYRPDWLDDDVKWPNEVRGEATIHYQSKDGRGRPCRNLKIVFEANFIHVIEANPESCN